MAQSVLLGDKVMYNVRYLHDVWYISRFFVAWRQPFTSLLGVMVLSDWSLDPWQYYVERLLPHAGVKIASLLVQFQNNIFRPVTVKRKKKQITDLNCLWTLNKLVLGGCEHFQAAHLDTLAL
jgi:hypothetical protein